MKDVPGMYTRQVQSNLANFFSFAKRKLRKKLGLNKKKMVGLNKKKIQILLKTFVRDISERSPFSYFPKKEKKLARTPAHIAPVYERCTRHVYTSSSIKPC